MIDAILAKDLLDRCLSEAGYAGSYSLESSHDHNHFLDDPEIIGIAVINNSVPREIIWRALRLVYPEITPCFDCWEASYNCEHLDDPFAKCTHL